MLTAAKTRVKVWLALYTPRLYGRVLLRRLERYYPHYRQLLDRLAGPGGLVVQAGPFAGLRYARWSAGSMLLPKIIGAYESELAPVVRQLVARPYPLVVNIGCGEGYYAVGLAVAKPQSRVVAIDIDPIARALCGHLAQLNGVAERVTIQASWSPDELATRATGRRLVIVDCEGAERDLLTIEAIQRLAPCDMLIELHDFVDPSISATLRQRFSASHRITTIDAVARRAEEWPVLAGLTSDDQVLALDEHRPGPMQWAFMEARTD